VSINLLQAGFGLRNSRAALVASGVRQVNTTCNVVGMKTDLLPWWAFQNTAALRHHVVPPRRFYKTKRATSAAPTRSLGLRVRIPTIHLAYSGS
jgi:hypothetical protein